jgi:acetyl esterase/lipase
MKRLAALLGIAFLLAGCLGSFGRRANGGSLADARKHFKTQIFLPSHDAGPVEPPPRPFELVRYRSPVGMLPAYLTPRPKDGKRHPAIVWIVGGDTNSIGDVWTPQPRNNDQSAAAYRKAGIVTMYPSLRGGNDNPGRREGFYGEIDDVVAARDYLAGLPYVDASRIYLGGHSTGGTLVLLTSETTNRFRAVFAFGPAAYASMDTYVFGTLDFRNYDKREASLRDPAYWLSSVSTPTFVIEGEDHPSNIGPLDFMRRQNDNPLVTFLPVRFGDHFSVLGPCNDVVAAAILKDAGPSVHLALTVEDLETAVFRAM